MLQRAALQWYIDNGVDEVLGDAPVDRFSVPEVSPAPVTKAPLKTPAHQPVSAPPAEETAPLLGAAEAQAEAIKLANAAKSLKDLKVTIAAFDGIEVKQTASNLVFADGNADAPVMLIGEAPGGDDDRVGTPFVGPSGQLLDRILSFIDIDRAAEAPENSIYISNILNWRPPGNRTPSPAEITASLPFIERHIALVKPKLIILCGGVAAKALLGRSEGISRLRKTSHTYQTQSQGLEDKVSDIPAIATYHPSYLLRTPQQKKAVWADMLTMKALLQKTGQSA